MCDSIRSWFWRTSGFRYYFGWFWKILSFSDETTITVVCKLTFYSRLLHQCPIILNLFFDVFNDSLYWQNTSSLQKVFMGRLVVVLNQCRPFILMAYS